jgi:glutamate carboxypeptidase
VLADPIVAYLNANLDVYLSDLRALAAIDSGSYHKSGVDQIQTWFIDHLNEMGFETARLRQESFGDDLLARRHGRGTRRVMLLGHADTVYPVGTAAARPMTITGDRLLGPGICDMKAGLLTGLYALRALDMAGWDGLGELTFLIVSDEEIGERHSLETLMRGGERHDAILTLEAARENGDIVTSRKASCWYTVEVTGRAAHAGVEPEKGRSATLALGHILVELHKLNSMKSGMTVNSGEISGGRAPNIVSDSASGRFDLRAWTNADLSQLRSTFERVACQKRIPGVSVKATVDPGSETPAMERTAGTELLEYAAIGIGSELGFSVKGAATGGGSDISFAGHAGTPGLDGLGPIGGLDHGPDEYILVSSIVPRTALLAKLIQRIGDDERFGYANRSE